MAVEYINVQGITDACKAFRDSIDEFDDCVITMNRVTTEVLHNWIGKGRNQFETQMRLMKSQLDDISDVLYDIYDALADAEKAYIDQDEAVAKEFTTVTKSE